jgi:CheY-like chemotaxis protein
MPAAELTVFVDDDPRFRANNRAKFEDWGYGDRAKFVAAPAEADALIAHGGVNHLVSDWKMPGRDGISYLVSVRRQRPGLRLSLLTAFSDDLRRNGTMQQELTAHRIDVYDKRRIYSEGALWLVRLAVPEATAGPAAETPPLPPTTTSLADMRLRLEALGIMNEERETALDLLAELAKIEDKESLSIYGFADRPYSVNDMIGHVIGWTEIGREFVHLHAQVCRGEKDRPGNHAGGPG